MWKSIDKAVGLGYNMQGCASETDAKTAWSLKIEQQNFVSLNLVLETQAQCEEISLKHFEKTQKSKLLRANETLKKKFTVVRKGTLIYNVLESLILAQDERWRRA